MHDNSISLFFIQHLLSKIAFRTSLICLQKTPIMKNSISKIAVTIVLLLSITPSFAQIKNAKTETVKIYGNCGMCETNIEKAGNLKKVASVDWNKDTKMATLTYDATKTNQDEILKRIALAGYDSDAFLAPDDVYANLHGCCQYDRDANIPVEEDANHPVSSAASDVTVEVTAKIWDVLGPMEAVFETYFELKNTLVASDSKLASAKAKQLLNVIHVVKMEALESNVHIVWMKVMSNLKSDTDAIATANDIAKQRKYFITLSENMYQLMAISKMETPIYVQHCPMANDGKGANWLSKDSAVKNPYYGSMMLSCGKTVETIK